MKNTFTREEMIAAIDAEITFAIDDYGWWYEDHWLTHEELANWTDDMFVAEFMLWHKGQEEAEKKRLEWLEMLARWDEEEDFEEEEESHPIGSFNYDDPENF